MKALISVYDKTGVVALARVLQTAGYELLSTGGTHELLSKEGLDVQQVSDGCPMDVQQVSNGCTTWGPVTSGRL